MAAINSNSMKLLQDNCNLTGPQVAGFQLVTLLCIVSRGREIPAAQHLACQKCLCQSTPCQALPGQHLCVLTCARQSVYSLTTAQCLLLQCRCASRAQPALVVFGLDNPLLEHFAPGTFRTFQAKILFCPLSLNEQPTTLLVTLSCQLSSKATYQRYV